MTITSNDLVKREVYYCASYLVSTIAQPVSLQNTGSDIQALAEQAWELCAPLEDWESAIEEEGADNEITYDAENDVYRDADGDVIGHDAQEACEFARIDPHEREIFEHWIVSDWLARKLEEKGEKVDYDFAGLTIWARTTTGQGIAADYVIEQICEELNA